MLLLRKHPKKKKDCFFGSDQILWNFYEKKLNYIFPGEFVKSTQFKDREIFLSLSEHDKHRAAQPVFILH